MARKGLVRKGDGKDVHHTTGNPMNNSRLIGRFWASRNLKQNKKDDASHHRRPRKGERSL